MGAMDNDENSGSADAFKAGRGVAAGGVTGVSFDVSTGRVASFKEAISKAPMPAGRMKY